MEFIDYKALYEASQKELANLKEANTSIKVEQTALRKEHTMLQNEYTHQKTAWSQQKTVWSQQKSAWSQEKSAWGQEKSAWTEERALLIAELNNLRCQLFGMKSDKQVKLASTEGQLDLFSLKASEALINEVGEELKEEIKKQQEQVKKKVNKTPKRMALPEHLERKEVVIDPDGDLSTYKIIGSDSCEVLVIEPMKMWVKRIVRRKWALKDSTDISEPGIKIASVPSRTVKGELFDESALAYLLISKFVYYLPLHRIKQMFTREKIRFQPLRFRTMLLL